MVYAALGYTAMVMAVMLNAAQSFLWRPRRLAWVEVALFFVGRPEPVLGVLSEAQGRLRRRRESSSAPSRNAARRRSFRRARRPTDRPVSGWVMPRWAVRRLRVLAGREPQSPAGPGDPRVQARVRASRPSRAGAST